MLAALLKTLHVLGVVAWVGGMAFSQFSLRPSLALLDAPARIRLMHEVFRRFFAQAAAAALVVLVTGVALIALGGGEPRFAVQAMAMLGLAMGVVLGVVRLHLYPRLGTAVARQDWPAGAATLQSIRRAILLNLALGLSIIVIALGGA